MLQTKTKYQTRLSDEITASATSVVVDSVTDVPTAPFQVIVDEGTPDAEIMLVTAVTTLTKTLTVVRGWQGTTAVVHADKSLVRHCELEVGELAMAEGIFRLSPNGPTTIAEAIAAATSTLKIIELLPGQYDESFDVGDVNGLVIRALGPVTIRGDDSTAYVINVNPAAQTSTYEFTLEGDITISHRTGQVGLQIDNENVGRKLIVYLKGNVTFNQEGTGNSIDVDHTDTSEAIRVYADGAGSEVEGALDFVTKNADDRCRFTSCSLIGGIATSTDNIASEFTFKYCGIKHEGVSGGHASQKFNSIFCYSDDDAGTYATLDTNDLAGDHTENIVN